MKASGGGQFIFWMLRLLTAVGLTTVAVMIGQSLWQLQQIRTGRADLKRKQDQVEQASQGILFRVVDVRREIQTALDENTPPDATEAVARYQQKIGALLTWTNGPLERAALNQLETLGYDLAELEKLARAWRSRYDLVWQDLGQQRTLSRVRDLIGRLHSAAEIREGKQRFQAAVQLRKWRAAKGSDAEHLAQLILTQQAESQYRNLDRLRSQLAEVARLVETFDGVVNADGLADLKDNKFKPALDSLSSDITLINDIGAENGVLPTDTRGIESCSFRRRLQRG